MGLSWSIAHNWCARVGFDFAELGELRVRCVEGYRLSTASVVLKSN